MRNLFQNTFKYYMLLFQPDNFVLREQQKLFSTTWQNVYFATQRVYNQHAINVYPLTWLDVSANN